MRSLLPAVACLIASLPAQQPPAPPQPALVVLVREPSGLPVEGAVGVLQCKPAHTLPALRGLAQSLAASIVGDIATLHGKSNTRGDLRFEAPADARSGAGLVTTGRGLGALLPQLLPGRAQRIALQPMGEVTTAQGSEQFTLWARAHVPAIGAIDLPPQRGTNVRLPAGNYEVWAHGDDGWTWQRIDVASGRPTLLQFIGPAQRVRCAALLHPSGWPHVVLCEAGGECTLLGAAVSAPLSAIDAPRGVLVADRVLPLPPSRELLAWPPAADAGEPATFTLGGDAPTEGVAMFSLRRTATTAWQLLGVALPDAERRLRLPEPGVGDTWLLLVGKDHAPQGRPWSTTPKGAVWTLARGVPLVVHATTTPGEPAVDVLVDYVPDGADVATVQGRGDGFGTARLGPVLGPGTVRISDPRFANQEVAIDNVPLDGVRLVVSTGAVVTGRVLLDGGGPAPGTVVTLRDPGNRLRPAERAAVTGEDGSFRFEGLHEDTLVLFASAVRDGRTWSGRATVRGGSDGVDVTLRDEDPQLPRDRR